MPCDMTALPTHVSALSPVRNLLVSIGMSSSSFLKIIGLDRRSKASPQPLLAARIVFLRKILHTLSSRGIPPWIISFDIYTAVLGSTAQPRSCSPACHDSFVCTAKQLQAWPDLLSVTLPSFPLSPLAHRCLHTTGGGLTPSRSMRGQVLRGAVRAGASRSKQGK